MSRPLPALEIQNPTGSCWTCVEQGSEMNCDKHLPFCTQCLQANRCCEGYHVRLRKPSPSARSRTLSRTRGVSKQPVPMPISTLGASPEEDHLLRHFTNNLARMSVAVDYDGNGYRRFAAVALQDAALLNSLLAVSSAHLCRLQNRVDTRSKTYLQRALQHLHNRLLDPVLARSTVTMMTMCVLLLFELVNEGTYWEHHFYGILSWIESSQNSPAVQLDEFLVSSVTSKALQALLHSPGPTRTKSLAYFDSLSSSLRKDQGTIDVMIGYSLDQPKFIIDATRAYEDMQQAVQTGDDDRIQAVSCRASRLKESIALSRTPRSPRFGLVSIHCSGTTDPVYLQPCNPLEVSAIREAASAASEIFRLALFIYIHRIVHPPTVTEGYSGEAEEMSTAVDKAFEILPLIPDTAGPGTFLGWAFVVIGAEIDALDRRQHIKRRLRSLQLLALNQGLKGMQVLDEVWRRRDAWVCGEKDSRRCRWQEVVDDFKIDVPLI